MTPEQIQAHLLASAGAAVQAPPPAMDPALAAAFAASGLPPTQPVAAPTPQPLAAPTPQPLAAPTPQTVVAQPPVPPISTELQAALDNTPTTKPKAPRKGRGPANPILDVFKLFVSSSRPIAEWPAILATLEGIRS